MAPLTFTPTLTGHKLLILQGFAPAGSYLERLHQQFPGLKIDYKVLSSEEDSVLPSSIYDGVTMLMTFNRLPTKQQAPNLRFVQLSSAGSDHVHEHELYRDPEVVFCTANGIHPPQISEWVIGTFLSLQHRFPFYQTLQDKGVWDDTSMPPVQDAVGLRMGILGYGAIGRQTARLAHALGMTILAFTHRSRPTPLSRHDDSYCVPGTGDPEGLLPSAWYHGTTRSAINDFLSQDLDILVICLPLTPLTKNIIGAEQFQILRKRKTFLSNVGRGAHVVTDELVRALEEGWIRGAAVDVTEPEPLPAGHPLWKQRNCIVTPHVSWSSVGQSERVCNVLEVNLRRLAGKEEQEVDGGEGEGKRRKLPLINVVDRELSY